MEHSITSVAGTVLKILGAPGGGLEEGAAPADERVLALAPAGGVKKLLIYAPDAIGLGLIGKHPELFGGLKAAGFRKFNLQSVYPPKTPVCFASMFTGLRPEGHGIQQYEKPVLSCRTIFDALPAHGVRTAIVAVNDSSIDLIFRCRKVDYYSGQDDGAVTRIALELLNAGDYDCLLVYHQEYDDLLHASDPWNEAALSAVKRHLRAFGELTSAFERKWAALPRAALFAPDHGAHTDPATGKGAHGDNIPADMDVAHYWKFQTGA
jgi:hypothetical protein